MEPYHAPARQVPGGPSIELGLGSAGESTEPAEPIAPTALPAISETREEVVREGARRMLERALCAEVDAYLGRRRYDRVDDDSSGYRNGFARDREITIGSWAVEVRQPRVSDVPGHSPPFRSSILPRRRALSPATQRLFARLYLEGMSSGDFEPAFREILGNPGAPVRLHDPAPQGRLAGRLRDLAGAPDPGPVRLYLGRRHLLRRRRRA